MPAEPGVNPAGITDDGELQILRGPSAYKGGWTRFSRLLWRTSQTEFQLRYSDSVLGYAWTLLSPLLLFAVLYLAFTRVVRLGGQIENYASLLLFNIMMFQFFSEATQRSVTCLVTRESMIRKVEFPRLVVPLSVVLTTLLTLAFSIVIIIGFLVATGVSVRWTWLLVPLPIAGIIVFTTGACLLLSALYVRLRDVAQVWGALARAIFYASPILYPIEFFPDSWRGVLFVNPLAPLLAQSRVWLIDPAAPTYSETMGGSVYLLGPLAVFVAVCGIGAWLFVRRASRVAEEL